MKEALSRFKDTVKGEIRKALKVLRNDDDVEEMDTSLLAIGIQWIPMAAKHSERRSTHDKTFLWICMDLLKCFLAKISEDLGMMYQ